MEYRDKEKRRVGIIGLGKVGGVVKHVMEYWYDCIGYDLGDGYRWEDILETQIVLVCVSTPKGKNGRLDCSNIDDVLGKLSRDRYKGLVTIKSTVRVGYMDNASSRFPSLRLVYMPEFLRERSNFTWFVNPDRIVVSGRPEDIDEALSYFGWVEDTKILRMSHLNAELGKLAHNAYIATKVSFTNEMENICEEHGGDPAKVMSVIWADRRVKSKDHLRPYLGPYQGKCVPKDTRELINSTTKAVLLKAVEKVNESVTCKRVSERKWIYEKCSSDNTDKGQASATQ